MTDEFNEAMRNPPPWSNADDPDADRLGGRGPAGELNPDANVPSTGSPDANDPQTADPAGPDRDVVDDGWVRGPTAATTLRVPGVDAPLPHDPAPDEEDGDVEADRT